MSNASLALVVDDDPFWCNIFEEVLKAEGFQTEKAKTLREARVLIQGRAKEIGFAIVDIRLENADNALNQEGLNVLNILKSYNIPTVATSAFFTNDETQVVRDAFTVGGAKDFWFKNTIPTAHLQETISEIRKHLNAIDPKPFGQFLFVLVGLPILVFTILVAVVRLIPEGSVLAVIAAGITLVILLVVAYARFSGRITGEQFTDIVKNLTRKK